MASMMGVTSAWNIKRFAILDHELTQAAGELTPTLKAKRQLIAQRYAPLIRALYDQPAGAP